MADSNNPVSRKAGNNQVAYLDEIIKKLMMGVTRALNVGLRGKTDTMDDLLDTIELDTKASIQAYIDKEVLKGRIDQIRSIKGSDVQLNINTRDLLSFMSAELHKELKSIKGDQ